MTAEDRLWLGGWIAFCLGVADDNLFLKMTGIAMFLLAIWQRRKESKR